MGLQGYTWEQTHRQQPSIVYLDFEAPGVVIANPLIAFVSIGNILSSFPHVSSSTVQEGTDLRGDKEELKK